MKIIAKKLKLKTHSCFSIKTTALRKLKKQVKINF